MRDRRWGWRDIHSRRDNAERSSVPCIVIIHCWMVKVIVVRSVDQRRFVIGTLQTRCKILTSVSQCGGHEVAD